MKTYKVWLSEGGRPVTVDAEYAEVSEYGALTFKMSSGGVVVAGCGPRGYSFFCETTSGQSPSEKKSDK